MRTVFTNSMTAHVFCAQTQVDGRNSNRSMSFSGHRFYSYSALIGRIVKTTGEDTLLLSDSSFSITTQQHKSTLHRAWGYEKPILRVIALGNRYDDHLTEQDHERNIQYLIQQYKNTVNRVLRMVSTPYRTPDEYFHEKMGEIYRYLTAFALTSSDAAALSVPADLERYRISREKREKRRNQPAQVAKRFMKEQTKRIADGIREEKDRKWREKQAIINAENIKKWIAGEYVNYPYIYNEHAKLRRWGHVVQTSQGAIVPIAQAYNLYKHIVRHREEGRGLVHYDNMTIGQFNVNEIDVVGNIKAGCHRIDWEEIERFAKSEGW